MTWINWQMTASYRAIIKIHNRKDKLEVKISPQNERHILKHSFPIIPVGRDTYQNKLTPVFPWRRKQLPRAINARHWKVLHWISFICYQLFGKQFGPQRPLQDLHGSLLFANLEDKRDYTLLVVKLQINAVRWCFVTVKYYDELFMRRRRERGRRKEKAFHFFRSCCFARKKRIPTRLDSNSAGSIVSMRRDGCCCAGKRYTPNSNEVIFATL